MYIGSAHVLLRAETICLANLLVGKISYMSHKPGKTRGPICPVLRPFVIIGYRIIHPVILGG